MISRPHRTAESTTPVCEQSHCGDFWWDRPGRVDTIHGVTDDQEPFDPGKLRASNADREAVAQKLQTAMSEGRLTVAELQERLDTVYGAKTLSELEPVTYDLPGHTDLVPKAPTAPSLRKTPSAPVPAGSSAAALERVGGIPTSSLAVGIMSGATRGGAWVVPTQFTALALMGGIDLDLTKAGFAEREVTITAIAVMGGIDITVPDDINVIVNGIGFMGAFEDNARLQGVPGGPIVRINGLALMGGVDVKRPKKPRRGEIGE